MHASLNTQDNSCPAYGYEAFYFYSINFAVNILSLSAIHAAGFTFSNVIYSNFKADFHNVERSIKSNIILTLDFTTLLTSKALMHVFPYLDGIVSVCVLANTFRDNELAQRFKGYFAAYALVEAASYMVPLSTNTEENIISWAGKGINISLSDAFATSVVSLTCKDDNHVCTRFTDTLFYNIGSYLREFNDFMFSSTFLVMGVAAYYIKQNTYSIHDPVLRQANKAISFISASVIVGALKYAGSYLSEDFWDLQD